MALPTTGPAMLRRAVLALAAVETLIWVYLVVGGSHDALFFAKGYGQQAAQLAHLVFVLFVLPALILGALNRALGIAALLAGFAALAYGFDPWLRAMTLFDGASPAGLYGLAVVMLLAAGCIAVARAALKRSAA